LEQNKTVVSAELYKLHMFIENRWLQRSEQNQFTVLVDHPSPFYPIQIQI